MYGPSTAEELESAATAAARLSDEARQMADHYWTGDDLNKLEKITDCLSSTPAMHAAAGEVGAAYRHLSTALDAYRKAAKRALDQENERTRR